MKNYKVLLCDAEEGFVVALMNYLNRNPGIPILAMAFTELEPMLEYLSSHKADLLVINAGWSSDQAIATNILIPVLWVLEEQLCEQGSGNYIPKYTAAPVYSRRMLQLLSEQGTCIDKEGNGICIAVYSPLGRCGKTKLSHGLCKEQIVGIGFPNGKSIYIGMEEFCESEEDARGMEPLLYYVKQKTTNISMKMKSLAMEGQGYDILGSALTYQELRELKREELQWFLECVRKEGCYDLLAADIGSGSLSSLELLLDFDVIYLPYLQDEHSKQKIRAFCRGLRQYGIWEPLSMKCYPVLMEDNYADGKEVLQLEEKRRIGGLSTLGDLYGNRFEDEEQEVMKRQWNSSKYAKR